MQITHAFQSEKEQGSDATLASKNEWNAAHTVASQIQNITTTANLDATKDVVTLAAGTYAVTVPAATGTGHSIYVYLNGAGVVSLLRSGSDTIAGQTTVYLVGAGDWCVLTDQAAGVWGMQRTTLLDDLDVFKRDVKRTFLSQIPVTGYRTTVVGDSVRYVVGNVSDGTTLPGGSERITNSAWAAVSPIIIPAALNSVPWGIAWKVTLPVAASGTNIQLGLTNDAVTNGVRIVNAYAADTTHLVLNVGDAAAVISSFVIDGAEHVIALTFDLTTVRLSVDGTVVASTTTLTGMTSSATNKMRWISNTGVYANARYIAWAW